MPLSAAQRVALVIGNNRYSELPDRMQLTSPVADATDVAAALKALGYTIITGQALTDASRDAITTASEKFAAESKGAEAAVFFYSGHGVQVGEDNYILPTDTPKLTGMSMLKNRGVLLRDSIMVGLEEAGARTKVIILDCCRDNPFSAQLEAALSGIGKSVKTKSVGEITGYGPGFYLAFATSPGTTASDGNGQRNSPFTAAMLNAIPKSAGKDIDFFFRDVKVKLGTDQVSWTNHSLTDSFSLGAAADSASEASSSLTPVDPSGASEMEKLQREITELKNRQAQLDGSPTLTAAELTRVKSELDELRKRTASTEVLIGPQSPLPNMEALPESGYFDLKGLFSDSFYASFNSYSQSRILRRAQDVLRKAGYYTGASDGVPGRGTHRAIIRWQNEKQIAVTGRLSSDTLSSMSLAGLPAETEPEIKRSLTQTPRPASRDTKTKVERSSTSRPAASSDKEFEMSPEEFLRRAKEL
jgi:uncharacterized caspase-like protein